MLRDPQERMHVWAAAAGLAALLICLTLETAALWGPAKSGPGVQPSHDSYFLWRLFSRDR
jgi:hypothetical protein